MIPRETTKDVLMKSLHELMETVPFDNITVAQICDNCQVSKATFYRYFSDKYDLLACIYRTFVTPLISNIETIEGYTWKSMLEDALDIISADRAFYRNGFKNANGQNSLSEVSADFDIECAARIISRENPSFCNDEGNLFVLRSYIMGYRIILDRMFVSDREIDRDRLVSYIYDCMPQLIRDVLPWED